MRPVPLAVDSGLLVNGNNMHIQMNIDWEQESEQKRDNFACRMVA